MPRMEQVQVREVAGKLLALRQPGAVFCGSMPGDGDRRLDRLAQRGRGEIGGACMAALDVGRAAELYRHADPLVAIVLQGVD